MTVTASSGSPRVSPQLFDTLPLSSVRQAEQQDRFPDNGELDSLVTFFRTGQDRIEASRDHCGQRRGHRGPRRQQNFCGRNARSPFWKHH